MNKSCFIQFKSSAFAQVLSKGHLQGPAGVKVSLKNAGEDQILQMVFTQAGGQ